MLISLSILGNFDLSNQKKVSDLSKKLEIKILKQEAKYEPFLTSKEAVIKRNDSLFTILTKFGVKNENILDVYAFTEQLGTVYISRGDGMKEIPKISKVIVRDPYTLEVMKDDQEGLLQFLNPIPYSYPGLSVLTDDLGIKKTIDNKEYFEITGRAKNSEIRGCGDILSETM